MTKTPMLLVFHFLVIGHIGVSQRVLQWIKQVTVRTTRRMLEHLRIQLEGDCFQQCGWDCEGLRYHAALRQLSEIVSRPELALPRTQKCVNNTSRAEAQFWTSEEQWWIHVLPLVKMAVSWPLQIVEGLRLRSRVSCFGTHRAHTSWNPSRSWMVLWVQTWLIRSWRTTSSIVTRRFFSHGTSSFNFQVKHCFHIVLKVDNGFLSLLNLQPPPS
jgi:hypothetical protein